MQNEEFINRVKRDFSSRFGKTSYKVTDIIFLKVIKGILNGTDTKKSTGI